MPRRRRGRCRILSSRWRWGDELPAPRLSSAIFPYPLLSRASPLSPHPVFPRSFLLVESTTCFRPTALYPSVHHSVRFHGSSSRSSSAFLLYVVLLKAVCAPSIPTSCIYCIINVHVRCTYDQTILSSVFGRVPRRRTTWTKLASTAGTIAAALHAGGERMSERFCAHREATFLELPQQALGIVSRSLAMPLRGDARETRGQNIPLNFYYQVRDM